MEGLPVFFFIMPSAPNFSQMRQCKMLVSFKETPAAGIGAQHQPL
jgi:hypothetical protein